MGEQEKDVWDALVDGLKDDAEQKRISRDAGAIGAVLVLQAQALARICDELAAIRRVLEKKS